MLPVKKVVVVAGEESGDAIAAKFIKELVLNNSNLQFSGIGGRNMKNAGVELISDLARYGVTGLTEVLRHFKIIKKAFKDIKEHLSASPPDLLILVDYPGFNLRLAKFAKKKLGIRVLYYISPQVWAWKSGRINTIREYVDHMAVIFPFEKAIYQAAGVPVSYVGHPLVDTISHKQHTPLSRKEFNLPENKRLIAMLPGSRLHEIERHIPVMIRSAQNLSKSHNDLHFIIPIAGTIQSCIVESYFQNCNISYTLLQEKAIESIRMSDCVVVASGTASLECALLEKPMCIIYKASPLTYLAASQLIKVNYLGLCNLLQNKMIVPELLQYDCNAVELTRTLMQLLDDSIYKQNIMQQLSNLKHSLSSHQADCRLVSLIENELNEN